MRPPAARLLRTVLACALAAATLAGCGGDVRAYPTYGEAAREVRLPDFVPPSAREIRVLQDEGGKQWVRFEVASSDAQAMVAGMRSATLGEARTGDFSPPSWKGDWPEELRRNASGVARSSIRFYRTTEPGRCLALDWLTVVAYVYPCAAG